MIAGRMMLALIYYYNAKIIYLYLTFEFTFSFLF
jgi:hypothetical protein